LFSFPLSLSSVFSLSQPVTGGRIARRAPPSRMRQPSANEELDPITNEIRPKTPRGRRPSRSKPKPQIDLSENARSTNARPPARNIDIISNSPSDTSLASQPSKPRRAEAKASAAPTASSASSSSATAATSLALSDANDSGSRPTSHRRVHQRNQNVDVDPILGKPKKVNERRARSRSRPRRDPTPHDPITNQPRPEHKRQKSSKGLAAKQLNLKGGVVDPITHSIPQTRPRGRSSKGAITKTRVHQTSQDYDVINGTPKPRQQLA
jgi:hypothetical protein